MNEIIKNNHGHVFPPAMVYAGYIFLVFGIIAATTNWILGIILISASVFISFSFFGIEIDIHSKKYKTYSIYFGIKTGKWVSLDKFFYLTLFCNNEIYEIHSNANITSSTKEQFIDIYLLDKQHREKLLLKRFKSAESAVNYANKISQILNLELVKYNPVLSKKSILNRNKR